MVGEQMVGEQMVASLERYQPGIENCLDAISLVNVNWQVLYASATTAKVLGYPPEELLGRNSLDLLHPQDRDVSVRNLKKVLEDPGLPTRTQARFLQKDGKWRWVETTASNLLDEPRVSAIVMYHREIAKRRAEEEEERRRIEELVRCNSELEAFAHTIAHDLREPLRTISAFTSILARTVELDEAHAEIATFIVEGVRRMTTILDDLLASATSGFQELLSCVELQQAAAAAMQNLRAAIATSGAVITIEELPCVRGVESELVRVFQNLISNAIKFRSEAALEIRISAARQGPDWVIRVKDNGIGIAAEHHFRIFGLFTRVHSKDVDGTGLGLALCKKIVEGLGGAIWVESEPRGGAAFCFTLSAGMEGERSNVVI